MYEIDYLFDADEKFNKNMDSMQKQCCLIRFVICITNMKNNSWEVELKY